MVRSDLVTQSKGEIRPGYSQDGAYPRPHIHRYLKEFDLYVYSVDIQDLANNVQARHSITLSSKQVSLIRYKYNNSQYLYWGPNYRPSHQWARGDSLQWYSSPDHSVGRISGRSYPNDFDLTVNSRKRYLVKMEACFLFYEASYKAKNSMGPKAHSKSLFYTLGNL